jgi:DNA adenine methylase
LTLIKEAAQPAKNPRPIIKWTGGKFEEFPMFARYIPRFENYYEPFFGGGGVFFALRPEHASFLNDKSSDLARFYSQLNSPAFKDELLRYADAWEKAGQLSHKIIGYLSTAFADYVRDKTTYDQMKSIISDSIEGISKSAYQPLFEEHFIINTKDFVAKLKASLNDKFKRIKHICAKEGRVFDTPELEEHIETGIKSGLYLYLRDLMNKNTLGTLELSKEKATANWYFVREFCYASMFRFNRKKEFNIPYGGIAYNRKNFRVKSENIFASSILSLFKQATFYNLDFAEFIRKTQPGKNDFIFLDPPYDSEFSEYDQNAFTKDDQVRLRDTLLTSKAKCMLVIKETEFIRSIYTAPGIHFIEFDKTYTYNVRGRNNRDTKHLIIVNYNT